MSETDVVMAHSRGRHLERLFCSHVQALLLSLYLLACFVLSGCSKVQPNESDRLFELLHSDRTNVEFVNQLEYAYAFNIYRYRNFYNGGGVALGDVNRDGLLDIYLVGNQTANRLYLNEGNFRFTDITATANVAGEHAWSTGVSMVDVNGDGWLDIYVCNSGIVEGDDKANELFINNGDSTFTESAADYGLADTGLSIHGSFFDYDLDGDLDMYLVNNSFRNIGSFNLEENTRHIRHREGGDRMYRNEGTVVAGSGSAATPHFVDVSADAGIYGSEIGFGLGVSVGDLNRDGWPDLYVSNDFFERDYLYINSQDGTFRETLERSIASVSAAAMGADMADLNGDGYMEIFVTDMLPKKEKRLKTISAFDSWDRYRKYIADDYHHQFTRNTLHLSRGASSGISDISRDESSTVPNVYFSEIGRMAGVEASDWSWGAMIADFDLDGVRDLFVANGIFQDLTNADYLVEIRDERTMNELVDGNRVDFDRLIDMIPSIPIPNYMFAGSEDLQFTDVTDAWGLSQPGFSNGSAYGDLDNDGDLDLVVNNLNMEAFVYRNRAAQMYPERAWLQIEFDHPSPNTFAVGAQATAWSADRQWYAEQQPIRGFQSTVDHTVHIGLGSEIPSGRVDSLVVNLPNGEAVIVRDVAVNQRLVIRSTVEKRQDMAEVRSSASTSPSDAADVEIQMPPEPEGPQVLKADRRAAGTSTSDPDQRYLRTVDPEQLGLAWHHRENEFNDFEQQPLLFHMRSTEGPAVCTGDADGDGTEDLYLGGARDQPGTVFVQEGDGRFREMEQPALENDRISEDTDCAWLDVDGDGDLDLYVGSGGSEFPASSSALMDRLYVNDGTGTLERSNRTIISAAQGFEPTGAVAAADYDADGDVDLFVGARMQPFAHGVPANGHLLLNDGNGQFEVATETEAQGLEGLGMITDAAWGDIDGDDDLDLLIAGEWMSLTLFENQSGVLVRRTGAGLDSTAGWWNAVHLHDLDGDGDLDLIGANHGHNSRFRASVEEPVQMWIDDFDGNGSVEQVVAMYRDGHAYPLALRHDLIDQIPSLVERYPTYESYAEQTVHDVFTEDQLRRAVHLQAVELRSVVGWNDGTGNFRVEALPNEAQMSPMYAIAVVDITSDGRPDVLLGGNFYEAKPEVGRYDASYGVALEADSEGLGEIPFRSSGFWVTGPIRKFAVLAQGESSLLVVARNNDSLKTFTVGAD